jgi:hypothetical protein
MRNHSNNFILLRSKMKTSISAFRKTVTLPAIAKTNDTMEYYVR